MRPRPGEETHDHACGSAGLLVKLQLVARELDPRVNAIPIRLTGQELQAESYAVAQMNGIIHDMQIEIARGDTMINPKFRTADGKVRGFDIVVANPMWNQPFNTDLFKDDPLTVSALREAQPPAKAIGVATAHSGLHERPWPRCCCAGHRRSDPRLRLQE